ncbi:MAG TPA: thiamine phosphate synthase [Gemmatimonadaceae bacterium]
MSAIPVVHAVTDDLVLGRGDFLDRARAVMRALGARGALHLRGRLHPAARLYELALSLLSSQERTGCWVVVSDRVDLARAARARGVQLTSRSLRVADARRIAPDLAVGASVHAAPEACVAAEEGADWVVAGHVYATPSHAGMPGRGVALVRSVVAASRAPCIAIGGVRPEHVGALIAAGAHGVAVIRGIWSASDAERAAIDYLSEYDTHRGG